MYSQDLITHTEAPQWALMQRKAVLRLPGSGPRKIPLGPCSSRARGTYWPNGRGSRELGARDAWPIPAKRHCSPLVQKGAPPPTSSYHCWVPSLRSSVILHKLHLCRVCVVRVVELPQHCWRWLSPKERVGSRIYERIQYGALRSQKTSC